MPSHIATVTTEHGEELWGKQKIEPEVINPHDIRNTRLINSFTTKVDTIKRNGLYFALVSRKGGCFFRIYWPEKRGKYDPLKFLYLFASCNGVTLMIT